MSERLKTDIALFAAAFMAIMLVLGANTNVETWLGALIAAR